MNAYVVASHQFGNPGTFLPPQQINGEDDLWWYPDGGTITPDGTVYFSENGESGSPTNQGHVNGPDVIGVFRCPGSASLSCGTLTLAEFGTSAAPPPCPVFQCYPDYYDATPSVAADSTGHLAVAYTFSTVAGGPKSLYTATSADGVTWSAPRLVNSRGGQEEGRKQGAGGNNSHSVTMPCIAVIGCLSSVGHWATGGL